MSVLGGYLPIFHIGGYCLLPHWSHCISLPVEEKVFFVRGSRLLTASNKVLTENSVAFLGQTDCGYEGCASSCINSLQEQLHKLSEMVPWFWELELFFNLLRGLTV